ncbi:hypothetical protein [Lentibacter algarum]|uniref:hypothetical protein n=1 Tax=Lentibacter algarum TaxID=576131 RepID=UPI003AF5642C
MHLTTCQILSIYHFQQFPDFINAEPKLTGGLDERKALELVSDCTGGCRLPYGLALA